MAYKVKADYTFTYERETTYGTAVDSAPVGINTEDMTFSFEPNKQRFMRAMGIRGLHESNVSNNTFGVFPTASVSVRMTPQLMEDLLPGILQKTNDWTNVDNVWTMYTNNYSNLPSPKTTSSGYFYTLVRNSSDTGNDEYLTSALPTSLKLSIDPTNNNGILTGDFEFIAKDYTRSATQTGNITNAPSTNAYEWGNIGDVTFDGNSFADDFVSCEINITSGAKHISDLPDGEIVFPKWEVTGTLKVIENDYTETMKDYVLSSAVSTGRPLVISFGDGTVSSAGEMNITCFVYLTNWSSEYEEGEIISYEFEGVFGGAGEYPIKVEFYNA